MWAGDLRAQLWPCRDFQTPSVCVVLQISKHQEQDLRKKHLPNRGGDGMKTWSTGHYKIQPFACDSLPVPARGAKEIIHKVVGLVFQNLSNASTSHLAAGKSYSLNSYFRDLLREFGTEICWT